MLSVGDQVEVIGELDGAGQLLQDVYAEALTAEFGVGLWVANNSARGMRKSRVIKNLLWQLGLSILGFGNCLLFFTLFQGASAAKSWALTLTRQQSEGQAMAGSLTKINVS